MRTKACCPSSVACSCPKRMVSNLRFNSRRFAGNCDKEFGTQVARIKFKIIGVDAGLRKGSTDRLIGRKARSIPPDEVPRHFTVVATRRICLSMEARRSLGKRSRLLRPFHAATARSVVSTAIFHSGLAGMRAASAKRRIWSGVISERLRLPPKLRASVSPGM